MHGIQLCRIVELGDDLIIFIDANNWGKISDTDKAEICNSIFLNDLSLVKCMLFNTYVA